MKGILFNTEMTTAILNGRKTVTRRVVSDRIKEMGTNWIWNAKENLCFSPYKIGDILYVRETFRERWGMTYANYGCGSAYPVDDVHEIEFKAGGNTYCIFGASFCPDDITVKFKDNSWSKWRPSIHMPKKAARIFLKVTAVSVERLQDITEEQAYKEGVITNDAVRVSSYTYWFALLWNKLTKKQEFDKYGWNANPFVWVIEFERVVKPNES